MAPVGRGRVARRLKRLMDVVGAATALTLFALPMAAIAVAVWACLGRPILFTQKRAGYRGTPFTLYKFRTMTDCRDESGNLAPPEKRMTRLGEWLRRTSLDELPGFYNVLVGDMSLVGPRPLLVEYLCRYTPEQARRHDVKPGITGWAQIHGRNLLTWEEKFRYDVWYVDNWSIWLDLRILVATVGTVIRKEGISAPGHATMPPFRGPAKGDE